MRPVSIAYQSNQRACIQYLESVTVDTPQRPAVIQCIYGAVLTGTAFALVLAGGRTDHMNPLQAAGLILRKEIVAVHLMLPYQGAKPYLHDLHRQVKIPSPQRNVGNQPCLIRMTVSP